MSPDAGVLESLDVLKQRVLDVRSRVPFFPTDTVGHSTFGPVSYYETAGLTVTLSFDPPISEESRLRLNDVGRWVNEAAVVTLVATLVGHGVFKDGGPHRKDVECHEHVNIARNLRNIIVKEGGRYKPEKSEHQRDMALLVRLYGVPPSDETFPLDIDKVLVPMIDACRRHADACLALEPWKDPS